MHLSTPTKLPPQGLLTIALLAGMIMGLAPAPGNAWFLAWGAIVPLWVLVVQISSEVNRTSKGLPKLAFLLGVTWGVGYNGLALSWIRDLHPLTWMGIPWLASVAITFTCWLLITLWGGLLVGVWAGGLAWANQRGLSAVTRIVLGTALWCGLETVWSWSPLEWTFLSFTQSPHDRWILHLGQLAGPMLVTGAIVAFNGFLAEGWLARESYPGRRAKWLWALGLVWLIGLHGIGWGLVSRPAFGGSVERSLKAPPEAALRVGIVQGNIPTRIKLFEEGTRLSIDNYTKGYETLVAQGVQAVLTPEGTFPWLWLDRPLKNPFYRTLLDRGILAWVGTVGLEQGKLTQSLVTIAGDGEILSRYDKVKLVPLGEYVPFAETIGQFIGRLSPVEASLTPGQINQQVKTPFGQAIVGICFDSAFSYIFRNQARSGGEFILTASNNDPYGAAMMAQHHAQDVMRAIETDRWAVRATNTGFSGIVNPHGETEWLSGFRTFETHAHTIARRQTQTPYVRWGNWFTPLLSLLAIGLCIRDFRA
ncbi:apolipoprotein N-acyltransferase [Leptolyngbya ohadii]|uniref:apolipoprotein N-acyltransferase n=1 Tax=Leptolyngbya ohadii TaxID=1962290 RepID=UPI000B59E8C1|nr:apolipoprotein N-acyltransferase [Leptolyngbya ohadii]